MFQFSQPSSPHLRFEVREPGAPPWQGPKATSVELDLAKIDAALKTNAEDYVGPEGWGAGNLAKHQRVLEILNAGGVVEMPIMSATLSQEGDAAFLRSTRVRDGRHRLYQLYAYGEARVIVCVPLFQRDQFLRLLG